MFKALLLVALLLGPPLSSPSRVALSVSPNFMGIHEASSKGVKVTTRIEPDDRNRAACVFWESEAEVGSHCLESDQLTNVPTTQIYIRLHTPGHYEFVLVLEATDKRYTTALQSVEVN